MNILITGACGHIGSYLVENLHKIKKIKKAFLIDNLESNRLDTLFNYKRKNKIEFIKRDLTDPKSLKGLKNINIVIHLASMTNAANSFKLRKEMYSNNLNSFKTVVNFCKKNRAKLIHVSTTSVYTKNVSLVDENCEKKYLTPQSPYAKIKLLEEKILKNLGKKLKYNTFRFGTIAGVSKGIRFHTAVNNFCLSVALGENVKVYKTALHQYRPYLSLGDAFKLFKFTIEKNFYENDVYNVVSNNYTVYEIINKIRKYRKNIKISYVYSPIMNRLSYHVSKKKLYSKGLNLNSNLNQDLANTLNLFRHIQ